MPELLIKYKNPKVKQALKDFSKYLDFSIEQVPLKKSSLSRKKPGDSIFKQIEKGLHEVKKIKKQTLKGISINEMLNEK